MKIHYLILLFALLFTVAALLVACNEPATTTAVQSTTDPGTTAEPPAESTVTTVTTPPETTTALAVSKNPIKKVEKLSNGTLRITYMDTTRNALGAIGVRDGYNSAEVTAYSLDAETGVLTLTLLESAATNTANRHLGTAPEAVTLRLREMGGKLEWASATTEDWQVLCTKGAAKVLEQLASAAGVGKVEAAVGEDVDYSVGEGMIFLITGNELRFRATDWLRDGYDICTRAYLHSPTNNGNFMMNTIYELPSNTAKNSTANGTTFKGAGDEIPAININNTYIGAAHGYNIIAKIPNTDKTLDDIGSVWKKANGQHFVLVRIVNGMLWFCPFDDDSMADGDFGEYAYEEMIKAGDALTHVPTEHGDATHTSKIVASASNPTGDMQFYVATNHVTQRAFLNGTIEVDLLKNGVYEAEFVDFYEYYDVLYLPAVLEYLMENIGDNDNDSCHDESINTAYISFIQTHRFHRNGSYTAYVEHTFRHDVNRVEYYGVMSGAFSTPNNDHYLYAPGSTNAATPVYQTNTTFYVTGDPTVVRSYFQLTDLAGTKSMNVGYYPYFGVTTDETRPTSLVNAKNDRVGWWYSSRKMYPYCYLQSSVAAGEKISFIGYHIPAIPIDDDFYVINWYFVGDEVFLSLHTDHAVTEKTVTLPNYLNGMIAEVDQKSDSFTVHSASIADNGITVSTDSAGYAIIKLTPAN